MRPSFGGRASVRACVRACVPVCGRVCMRACVQAFCACVREKTIAVVIIVVAMSLPLQIALPAKMAPKYTILGCVLATVAFYLVKNSLRQNYSFSLSSYPLPPLPPPHL